MPNRAVWGDFEVDFDALLGRGGFGAVYRGRQISLERPVAVKVLDVSRAGTDELECGFREKFEAEAKVLARIRDSRIITVYQAGHHDGTYWYAMELIEGVTLDERITREGALDGREAARIALHVAHALEAAHAAGITHRDVKPANIFLLADGGVKLGDFGIARSMGARPGRLTEANALIATPEYCSPEQGMGDPCDHRSDIYSLGVVLFEMVAERPPFGGGSLMETLYKQMMEPPPSPRALNPNVSPALERLILRCLEKRAEARYQDYSSLIRDLEAVLAGTAGKRRTGSVAVWRGSAFLAGVALFSYVLASVYTVEPAAMTAAPQQALPAARPAGEIVSTQEKPEPFLPPEAPEPDVPAPSLLERIRAHVSPSGRELEMLRELQAAFVAHEERLRRREYAGLLGALERISADPRQTEYTRLFTKAAQDWVGRAARLVDATERTLRERSGSIHLSLGDGERLSGTVVRSDASGITVQLENGSTRTVGFGELALENYLEIGTNARAAFALQSLSASAAQVLPELLKTLGGAEDMVLWIPELVALAAAQVRRLAASRSYADAEAQAERVLECEREVVALFPDAREMFDVHRRERRAIRSLRQDDLDDVLVNGAGTAVHDEAARRRLSAFQASLRHEVLLEDGLLDWVLRPEAASRADSLRYWDVDRESGAVVLRDEAGLRSLVLARPRPETGQERGLFLRCALRTRDDSNDGHVRISLESPQGPVYLRLSRRELSARRLSLSDAPEETLAAAPLEGAEGEVSLAVIGGADRVFVFVNDRFLFAVPAAMASRFAVGVDRAEVWISELRVPEK